MIIISIMITIIIQIKSNCLIQSKFTDLARVLFGDGIAKAQHGHLRTFRVTNLSRMPMLRRRYTDNQV